MSPGILVWPPFNPPLTITGGKPFSEVHSTPSCLNPSINGFIGLFESELPPVNLKVPLTSEQIAVINLIVVPDSRQNKSPSGWWNFPPFMSQESSFTRILTPIFSNRSIVASVSSLFSGEIILLSPLANAEQTSALWV